MFSNSISLSDVLATYPLKNITMMLVSNEGLRKTLAIYIATMNLEGGITSDTRNKIESLPPFPNSKFPSVSFKNLSSLGIKFPNVNLDQNGLSIDIPSLKFAQALEQQLLEMNFKCVNLESKTYYTSMGTYEAKLNITNHLEVALFIKLCKFSNKITYELYEAVQNDPQNKNDPDKKILKSYINIGEITEKSPDTKTQTQFQIKLLQDYARLSSIENDKDGTGILLTFAKKTPTNAEINAVISTLENATGSEVLTQMNENKLYVTSYHATNTGFSGDQLAKLINKLAKFGIHEEQARDLIFIANKNNADASSGFEINFFGEIFNSKKQFYFSLKNNNASLYEKFNTEFQQLPIVGYVEQNYSPTNSYQLVLIEYADKNRAIIELRKMFNFFKNFGASVQLGGDTTIDEVQKKFLKQIFATQMMAINAPEIVVTNINVDENSAQLQLHFTPNSVIPNHFLEKLKSISAETNIIIRENTILLSSGYPSLSGFNEKDAQSLLQLLDTSSGIKISCDKNLMINPDFTQGFKIVDLKSKLIQNALTFSLVNRNGTKITLTDNAFYHRLVTRLKKKNPDLNVSIVNSDILLISSSQSKKIIPFGLSEKELKSIFNSFSKLGLTITGSLQEKLEELKVYIKNKTYPLLDHYFIANQNQLTLKYDTNKVQLIFTSNGNELKDPSYLLEKLKPYFSIIPQCQLSLEGNIFITCNRENLGGLNKDDAKIIGKIFYSLGLMDKKAIKHFEKKIKKNVFGDEVVSLYPNLQNFNNADSKASEIRLNDDFNEVKTNEALPENKNQEPTREINEKVAAEEPRVNVDNGGLGEITVSEKISENQSMNVTPVESISSSTLKQNSNRFQEEENNVPELERPIISSSVNTNSSFAASTNSRLGFFQSSELSSRVNQQDPKEISPNTKGELFGYQISLSHGELFKNEFNINFLSTNGDSLNEDMAIKLYEVLKKELLKTEFKLDINGIDYGFEMNPESKNLEARGNDTDIRTQMTITKDLSRAPFGLAVDDVEKLFNIFDSLGLSIEFCSEQDEKFANRIQIINKLHQKIRTSERPLLVDYFLQRNLTISLKWQAQDIELEFLKNGQPFSGKSEIAELIKIVNLVYNFGKDNELKINCATNHDKILIKLPTTYFDSTTGNLKTEEFRKLNYLFQSLRLSDHDTIEALRLEHKPISKIKTTPSQIKIKTLHILGFEIGNNCTTFSFTKNFVSAVFESLAEDLIAQLKSRGMKFKVGVNTNKNLNVVTLTIKPETQNNDYGGFKPLGTDPLITAFKKLEITTEPGVLENFQKTVMYPPSGPSTSPYGVFSNTANINAKSTSDQSNTGSAPSFYQKKS